MKIITISKVGYNHPSQANWSYGIWKVDLIDTKDKYSISYTTKENSGGDTRFIRLLEEKKIKVIETKGVLGTPRITGIAKMNELESEEFIKKVVNWYKNK